MIEKAELDFRLRAGRQAARALRLASRAQKDQVLASAERLLLAREPEVLEANAQDLASVRKPASEAGNRETPTTAFLDRLTLSAARLSAIRESLAAVRAQPDPVGECVDERRIASGVRARRVRSPLGVIYMIFEARPNVAIEAFSLAFKAGNAIILRGGKESMRTTTVLYSVLTQALAEGGLPEACLWGVGDPDRALTEYLLKQKQWIDLVVPRGGDQLIEFVTRNSEIPVIKNDRGLCHVFVHEDADLEMAARIVANAKTQRPGVCNSMETLLVHRAVARPFLELAYERLTAGPAVATGPGALPAVQWFGCPETLTILKGKPMVNAADTRSWDTEYLDFKMNSRVVGSLDEALEHIERHGSRHSEAIVTGDGKAARRFQSEVDAAAVYWNASTRFTDGFELGLGGELGISTQKLHVRGPVGLRELTSTRWVLDGEGQVRDS